MLYRQRIDLQRAFPNPFIVAGQDCYKAWYDAHPAEQPPTGSVQIDYRAPIATVVADLARHLNALVVAGRGGSRVKRAVLKLCIKFLWLSARLSGAKA